MIAQRRTGVHGDKLIWARAREVVQCARDEVQPGLGAAIPGGTVTSSVKTPDYDQAVETYGAPVERTHVYEVSPRMLEERRVAQSKRTAEVVLVVQRPNGRYLLHTKSFYPPGTYRLLTGGLKVGEPLLVAVQRELREETGLGGRVERFLAVQHHEFRWDGQCVPFTSYILWVAGECGPLAPHDLDEQITAFREATLAEVSAAAEQLEALPGDWADWGRFRATAHRLVVELLGATEAAA